MTWRTICGHRHRSGRALVACVFGPATSYLGGWGPFAVASLCPSRFGDHPTRTVTLWRTEAEARAALQRVNDTTCGGLCVGRHGIQQIAEMAEALYG